MTQIDKPFEIAVGFIAGFIGAAGMLDAAAAAVVACLVALFMMVH
jgi:hypothetical protein